MSLADRCPSEPARVPVSDRFRGEHWADTAIADQRRRLGALSYYDAIRHNPRLLREAASHRDDARMRGLS